MHGFIARGRRLAPLALALALAACSGSDDGPVAGSEPVEPAPPPGLSAVFATTGEEGETAFALECDPPGGDVLDPAAACERVAAEPATFFPEQPAPQCPLPAGLPTLSLTGTLGEGNVDLFLAPCSADEDRAIAEWAALFGHELR